jgi:hypothetical protein
MKLFRLSMLMLFKQVPKAKQDFKVQHNCTLRCKYAEEAIYVRTVHGITYTMTDIT